MTTDQRKAACTASLSTDGLCLSRAICIWCNKIMPALMTGLAQKGLRPAVGIIAEQVIWRPVMVLCSICLAHGTNIAGFDWVNILRHKIKTLDCRFTCEMGEPVAAVATNKLECFVPRLVNAPPNIPLFFTGAFFAGDVRPLEGFFCHE